MTPDLGEAFDGHGSGTVLPAGQRDEEMTDEELAQMPLESLLYYVLAGKGRRSL
jgi:hypothetical protein